jgi:hypothetical protein
VNVSPHSIKTGSDMVKHLQRGQSSLFLTSASTLLAKHKPLAAPLPGITRRKTHPTKTAIEIWIIARGQA